jgi:macrolide phosphotransferase
MARSPLTLAASVTAALPRVGVVGVGALTEGAAGRYDSAVAHLDDGRRVVVRVPAEPDTAPEVAAQARALRALTPGVRSLLPFRAPELLGETAVDGSRAIVVDFLPGYRVDAAHLPPGRGAATSVGAALAALHALPVSIVRTEGLPFRTPGQVRADAARLADRAAATGAVPVPLIVRWRRALDADPLWRFESAVVLGGAGAASFLFEDVDDVPHVTGVLEWHGLSVGDPAVDLQWLASAPTAAQDVFDTYVSASDRAPDAGVRERARLYAELEFAKWLVHGHDAERSDIVDDAVALLESLAATVAGSDLLTDGQVDVDGAIALLGQVPAADSAAASDTSMHTDAYDAAELSQWIDDDDDADRETAPVDVEAETARAAATAPSASTVSASTPGADAVTGPIDIARFGEDHAEAEREAERASRAAFQRWTSSASE